jgi:hypothetical protein
MQPATRERAVDVETAVEGLDASRVDHRPAPRAIEIAEA